MLDDVHSQDHKEAQGRSLITIECVRLIAGTEVRLIEGTEITISKVKDITNEVVTI